jgi:NAD+---dinitrogen-reductase ADP-D-ribosyltransferase
MSSIAFNLCNLPPWVIASRHFNEQPQALFIQGVQNANRFLFEKLDGIADRDQRGQFFSDYLSVKFQLHHDSGHTESARKALRNSYLRFLKGWMMESNSVEGAVLKGWVESRMGIEPTFHNGRITGNDSDAYYRYVMDRTRGSKRTNAINAQLDLLYEYCQYELRNSHGELGSLTLFRGTNGATEDQILEQVAKREQIVRLNNLVSFTDEEERAWEFGSIVWQVQVPISKIFFFDELLPTSLLKGEGEYLVIGGEYRVKRVMCTV